MTNEEGPCSPLSFLRLQSWLSPTFPNGAYSYSHGLEWAAEAGHVYDRSSLVDWLEADLCYGSGRNEAVFFSEAYRSAIDNDRAKLMRVAELAAAARGTSEFALESSQQATACQHTPPSVVRSNPRLLLGHAVSTGPGRCPRRSLGKGGDSGVRGATSISAQLCCQFGNRRRAANSPRANR